MNFKYENFLKAHEAKPGEISTHTRIGCSELNVYGKSYHIEGEDLPKFRQLYFEHVISKKNKEYLTEKQLTEGPLVVDFDFRYAVDVKERQHSETHLGDIIALYFEGIITILKIDEGVVVPVYVMHKKNLVEDTEKGVMKDGIHVIFGIRMNRNCRLAVRNLVLKDIPTFATSFLLRILGMTFWMKVSRSEVAIGRCMAPVSLGWKPTS
jgi:hypothetical protein